MASTTNLKIVKPVSEHDAQKIATLNVETDDLDNAVAGMLTLSVAGSSNVTLTRTQALNKIFKFTGVLTGNINVLYPVSLGTVRQFTVWNATTGAFTLTVKTTTGGSAGIAVTQGTKSLLAHDGTDVFTVTTSGAGSGDVTAASAFGTDNRLVRSDGTAKGVQSSGITIDDSNNVTGVNSISVGDGTVAGESKLFELTANGSNYISLLAPDSITDTLALKYPNANPTAGQALVYGAPSSNVSTGAWVTVGYLEIPQNSQSAAYTLVLADSGKHIYHPSADTTARIWTIPANSSVAFPIGTAITFVNDTSAGVITIAINTDTLVFAGTGATGSRTLAANGVATAIKMTSTRWMISGTGLA